ncbi:E3 ubiquitin-protein ligase Topors [Crotalus adamanteus]|uniref:E3 ubiquitin-protein ligase Topors n=1 Tax=Crotalus adamanteus TaxID=8729 RepID=A0AAW1C313_CROAD
MCDPRERRSRAAGASGRNCCWHQRSKSSLIPLANFFPKDNSLIPGKNRLHQTMPEEISPDSKCPICLDLFENVAYLDRCWHRFCFRCVLEWSKNKAECPLCKQPFRSIVHSMRSADDYKVHSVRPSEMETFANPNGRRFRYPTTLTGEHPARVNPQRTSSSRRTMSSPNCGILFEGLSTQTTRQRDAEMHQMIRRLQSRRQASLEGRFMRHIQEQEMISFRKEHFLHEFVNFARCPFNIDAYDEHANYDCPAPSREDGSNSESSIITISPDETETQAVEVDAFRSDTGQAPWDDETPGPSYSNLEQIRASAATALDSSESSDEDPSANITGLQVSEQANVEVNGDSCDSSDNCVIVDYVKPLAERTPELVQLSSDSDISADDGEKEDTNKVQPTQLRSFSDSDVQMLSEVMKDFDQETGQEADLAADPEVDPAADPEVDPAADPELPGILIEAILKSQLIIPGILTGESGSKTWGADEKLLLEQGGKAAALSLPPACLQHLPAEGWRWGGGGRTLTSQSS